MKVVVFQGGAVGGEPSREELLNLWYGELDGYPGIDEVVYRDKLELEKMDEQIGDADALYNALQTGKVYAAGLDVVTGEPLTKRCKLMDCRNTKITQHIAWAPAESRIRAVHIAAKNFKNYLEGHPTSVINL